MVLQHGLAHRHGGLVAVPLREEVFLRPGFGGGDVCGALHGVDRGFGALRGATAPGPNEHRRAARTAGLSGVWLGGAAVRDRGGVDDGESDALPRGAGVSIADARLFALQGDARHRPDRQRERGVPNRHDAAAGFRGDVGDDPDADGRGDFCGLLGAAAAGDAEQFCGGQRSRLQLGGWLGVVAERGVQRGRRFGVRPGQAVLRESSGMVRGGGALCGLEQGDASRHPRLRSSCRSRRSLSYETLRPNPLRPRPRRNAAAGVPVLR